MHADHIQDASGAPAVQGTLKSYLTGFGLSVVLTAIPFWIVMTGAIQDRATAALVVLAFAVVQILVHMVYFLHMNTRSENGWTMMALIFAAVMVIITIAGSIWVMHHLNVNMMPTMSPAAASAMP